jgi:hypothetical protein
MMEETGEKRLVSAARVIRQNSSKVSFRGDTLNPQGKNRWIQLADNGEAFPAR